MSFFQPQAKRPAVVPALVLSASLLGFCLIVPARSTFGQDEKPAESTAAAADEKQKEGAEASSDAAPAKSDAKSAESATAPAKPDASPAKPDASPAKPDTAPAKPNATAAKPNADPADSDAAPKKADTVPVEPKADPEWVAKGVWTLPPTKGAAAIDFSLVGEYVGDLKATAAQSADDSTDDAANSSSKNRLGVQIRNLGDGEFEARVYQGGLPGQDGFQNDKPMILIGRRSGQTLVLSGGPWAMFAGHDNCKIIDASGIALATLERAERRSPTLKAAPPEGAIVLFDGSDTSAFTNGEMTAQGLLKQGADVREMLADFDLHLEFRIPHMPKSRDQQRGNSGVYLQSRYECQVLDSFGDANVFNGLGALYRFKTPKINMAFPPLTWQTYDIHFTAARFAADGGKLRNARVTSWVNGVMVQENEELSGPTGSGKEESTTLLPTKIQDHGNPVRFRNIWVIDRGLTGGIEFPQMAPPAAKE